MKSEFVKTTVSVTMALVAIFYNECFAQINAKPKMIELEGHFVKSSINGKTYQLFVTLPFEYEGRKDKTYPVLYQLDGIYSFPIIHATKRILESQGEIEPVITVAIADSIISPLVFMSSRYYDFMPISDKEQDSILATRSGLPKEMFISGGSDEFIETLETDLIPFIDKTYRTNGDNGLAGHSAGGLFTVYCLFKRPQLFKRYAINSPPLQWKNDFLLDFKDDFFKNLKGQKKKIFVSTAENDSPDILRTYFKFKESLKKKKYQGLDLEFVEFENESHNSAIPSSISKTLTVLYARD
jgi:predicted alpha/beta superfamily hydrolase